MLTNRKTTCIIPFYNEGNRIFPVLDVVTKIQEIAQIICIDDGSTDNTANDIMKKWPEIELIRLPENQGKTSAIREGLRKAAHDFVLLMDADLQYINPEEITHAIHAMEQQSADMIILRRINAPWFVKMDRGDVLFSGERIMKRQDLEEILRRPVEGYQLEIAINDYMIENKKKVFWAPSSAFNTFKVQKLGLFSGFIKELDMFFDIIFFAGLLNYIRQVATFARNPCNVHQTKEASQLYQDQLHQSDLLIKQEPMPVQQHSVSTRRQAYS